MKLQDYVPTPGPPPSGVDVPDWTDPTFALPIVAAFVVLLALALLVVLIAVIASKPEARNRPRPPIQSTP